MLSADENDNKPIGKPGPRKAKAGQQGKKADRGKKAPQQEAKPDQPQETRQPVAEQASGQVNDQIVEQTRAPEMSADSAASHASPTETSVPAGSTESTPVSLQTLANAYGDYSKASLEQTKAFLEKLASVRSLDKAFELQTEFARAAFDTFVAESRRIRELHSELAKQRLSRLEGFVAKMTKPR